MDYGPHATKAAPPGRADSISKPGERGEFRAQDFLRRHARHRARENQSRPIRFPVETAVSRKPGRRGVDIQSLPSYSPWSSDGGGTNFFAWPEHRQLQLLLADYLSSLPAISPSSAGLRCSNH